MNRPLFVYGTLRPGHGNYLRLLDGSTDREIDARLPYATMYSAGGFPFVALDPANEAGVTGTLVTIAPEVYTWIAQNVDRLEGYRPGGTHNLYDKTVVQVVTADGETVEADMYVAPEDGTFLDPKTAPVVASGDWNVHCSERAYA